MLVCEGVGSPGGCEQPCECWELNTGSLREQPGQSRAELSLQPPQFPFSCCIIFRPVAGVSCRATPILDSAVVSSQGMA